MSFVTSDAKKREEAEAKRQAAVQEKLLSQQKEKDLIKQAFSGKLPNKKIVFDQGSKVVEKISKVSLFDDNDDNEEDNSSIVNNLSRLSERGSQINDKEAKLIELQSRFAHDPRFKVNENFLDDEENEDSLETRSRGPEFEKSKKEKEKTLGILETVLGKPLRRKGKTKLLPSQKSLIIPRFDPSKPESEKFIIKKKKIEKNLPKKTLDLEKDTDQTKKVSSERFYEVSETIKKGLESSEGFSFANLFGCGKDPDDDQDNNHGERECSSSEEEDQGDESDEDQDVEVEDDMRAESEKDQSGRLIDGKSATKMESDSKRKKQHGNSVIVGKHSESDCKDLGDRVLRKSKSNSQNDFSHKEHSATMSPSSHSSKSLNETSHELINVTNKGKGKGKSKEKNGKGNSDEVVISNPLLKYERFFLDEKDERLKKDTFFQPELIELHLKNWKEKRTQMITALTKKRRHFKHVEKLKSNIEKSDWTNKDSKKRKRIFKDTVKKH
ncbi:uncharacterized protein LOC141853010 isoform X2 [Brevipalpus obovatus]|uniref:uncharacterized protein LOC141853010 isoform X2 n=1 Tax=Brevipalpus obovatus TaxID=246614 RepID=UPI003D9EB54B